MLNESVVLVTSENSKHHTSGCIELLKCQNVPFIEMKGKKKHERVNRCRCKNRKLRGPRCYTWPGLGGSWPRALLLRKALAELQHPSAKLHHQLCRFGSNIYPTQWDTIGYNRGLSWLYPRLAQVERDLPDMPQQIVQHLDLQQACTLQMS